MSLRKLHPDWPEFDTAARSWDIDGPAGEIAHALEFGPTFGTATGPSKPTEGFQISEIARVVRYRVAYHDCARYDSEHTPDEHNANVWRPDNQISGSELDLVLIGQLTDGRWFSLEAGNDYTGWGCMGDRCDIRIGASEDQVVKFGLDQGSRHLLGYAALEAAADTAEQATQGHGQPKDTR